MARHHEQVRVLTPLHCTARTLHYAYVHVYMEHGYVDEIGPSLFTSLKVRETSITLPLLSPLFLPPLLLLLFFSSYHSFFSSCFHTLLISLKYLSLFLYLFLLFSSSLSLPLYLLLYLTFPNSSYYQSD